MTFPVSAAAIVFAFSSGIFAASLIYYLIQIINKKNFSSSKIIFSLLSLCLIIASVVYIYVLDSQNNLRFSFSELSFSELIFLVCVSVFGILFFCFTSFSFFIGTGCYAVFSVFSLIILTTVFSNNGSFELTVNAKEECQKIEVACYELNPKIIIPCKRFWYENPETVSVKKSETELNPVFKFMIGFLLTEKKILTAEIPPESFYPVVYQIDVKDSEINVFVKVKKLM